MNAESIAIGEYELRIPWLLTRVLGGTAVVLAVAVGSVQIAPYINRPVTQIRVDGRLQHLRALHVAAAASVLPNQRLFDLDINAMRTRLETLPWVAHAQVQRAWPDAVALEIVERVPEARWGIRDLLDTEGRVFTPPMGDSTYAQSGALPLLSGPPARVDEVRAAYRTLNETLGSGPFALAGLALDARGEWTAQTRSGIELRLGQDDPTTRVDLLMGGVARTLTPQMDRVAYIDLRYPNGFAVGWREGGTSFEVARNSGART